MFVKKISQSADARQTYSKSKVRTLGELFWGHSVHVNAVRTYHMKILFSIVCCSRKLFICQGLFHSRPHRQIVKNLNHDMKLS